MESILFEELEDFCKEHGILHKLDREYDYMKLCIDCRHIPEIQKIIYIEGFKVSLKGVKAIYIDNVIDFLNRTYKTIDTRLLTTLLSL